MNDTPLTQILRESVDPFVTSEAVERCLTAYASLERALDAATKERDEAKSYISRLPGDWFGDSSLKTWFPISCETMENQHATIVCLRAQLSELQSELETSKIDSQEWGQVAANRTREIRDLRAVLQRLTGSHDTWASAVASFAIADSNLSALQSATIRSPRIYTKCPACHNDTLTINDDKHLLCTWIECPNPTLIDKLGEATPQDHARVIEMVADRLANALGEWFNERSKKGYMIRDEWEGPTNKALYEYRLLKPQPRKEGEENGNVIRTMAPAPTPVSNAATEVPALGAEPTQDHRAPGGEAPESFGGDEFRVPTPEEMAATPFFIPATLASPRETTNGKADVSEVAREIVKKLSCYTREHLTEYRKSHQRDVESILTRLTGDQATRIAELEADKVRLDWLSANSLSYWRTESVALVITEYDGGVNLKDFCRSSIDAAMKEQP